MKGLADYFWSRCEILLVEKSITVLFNLLQIFFFGHFTLFLSLIFFLFPLLLLLLLSCSPSPPPPPSNRFWPYDLSHSFFRKLTLQSNQHYQPKSTANCHIRPEDSVYINIISFKGTCLQQFVATRWSYPATIVLFLGWPFTHV
jgi:hypothetical protein